MICISICIANSLVGVIINIIGKEEEEACRLDWICGYFIFTVIIDGKIKDSDFPDPVGEQITQFRCDNKTGIYKIIIKNKNILLAFVLELELYNSQVSYSPLFYQENYNG